MDRVKNIFITATIGFLLVTLLNSCHKYSEDPFISLRNPYSRLNGGHKYGSRQWKFTSYQVFGTEHSHDFDKLLAPRTLTDLNLNFVALEENLCSVGGSNVVANVHLDYELSGDYKIITFRNGPAPSDTADFAFARDVLKMKNNTTSWTIVELYGKTFHISSNGIDIYFKKQ